WQVGVPDALAVAVVERLELAVVQDGLDRHAVGGQKELANALIGRLAPARVVASEGELPTQRVGHLEVATEESLGLRTAPDRDEVEDLYEEPRPASAVLAHRVDERPKPGHEAIVANAQERPARDVADAGRLDDEHTGLPVGKPGVPVEDFRRHEPVV